MAVRLGFIGTGGVAQGHMKRLSELPEVEMVAYVDVMAARAEKAAADFGGKAYTDFRVMFDAQKLDGVVVCTPPFAHGDIELAACDLGVNLLIEKPVAISVAMAKPILAAIKASGIATVVAYKYRWDDHVIQARNMLADKSIGLVFGNFWGGTPGTPWWRVQGESGGQFIEQTTHIVDMARYLCGEVTTVQAFEVRGLVQQENRDIADALTANLQFASGAVGTISNTSILEGWGQSSLRVMATQFSLQVAGNSLSWVGADGNGESACQADGYTGEDRAFVKAIMGDRSEVYADYEEGVKSLAVSEAANLSAVRGGEPVPVASLF
jgi:myo-inositol 2-dehydrogenase / D-chiro-inositol 1-dehydrogenase